MMKNLHAFNWLRTIHWLKAQMQNSFASIWKTKKTTVNLFVYAVGANPHVFKFFPENSAHYKVHQFPLLLQSTVNKRINNYIV
jgi:hypothetical protein